MLTSALKCILFLFSSTTNWIWIAYDHGSLTGWSKTKKLATTKLYRNHIDFHWQFQMKAYTFAC